MEQFFLYKLMNEAKIKICNFYLNTFKPNITLKNGQPTNTNKRRNYTDTKIKETK